MGFPCLQIYVSLCLPVFLVLLLWNFLLFVCFALCYLGVFYFNLGNYLFSHGRNRGRGMYIWISGDVGRVWE